MKNMLFKTIALGLVLGVGAASAGILVKSPQTMQMVDYGLDYQASAEALLGYAQSSSTKYKATFFRVNDFAHLMFSSGVFLHFKGRYNRVVVDDLFKRYQKNNALDLSSLSFFEKKSIKESIYQVGS